MHRAKKELHTNKYIKNVKSLTPSTDTSDRSFLLLTVEQQKKTSVNIDPNQLISFFIFNFLSTASSPKV